MRDKRSADSLLVAVFPPKLKFATSQLPNSVENKAFQSPLEEG